MDQIPTPSPARSQCTAAARSPMGEVSVVVQDAVAEVVDAWTRAALQNLLKAEAPQQEPSSISREVHHAAIEFAQACVYRGVTHATAAAYSEAWIREGLVHSTSGSTLPAPTEAGDDPETDAAASADDATTGGFEQYVLLEVVRSHALAIATHAMQCALEQVKARLVMEETRLAVPENPPEPVSPPGVDAIETLEVTAADPPPRSTDVADVLDPKPASTDVVDDSDLLQDKETSLHDVRAEAASRFVSSLLDEAVIRRQHNASPSPPPCEAPETAVSPVVRTPTPPPEPRPAVQRPHVEISSTQRPLSHMADPELPSPRLAAPDPPVELAAVRPPKTGTRSRSKKPPPVHTTSSPPKTAETHSKHKTGHHRGSPTKPPAEEEDPPRLRKLEEYLELHPVDRAKKIYRPHQTPRGQLPSLQPPRSPSGYDAETDDSEDDDLEAEMLHLKPRSLKKLRPVPKFPATNAVSKARPPPVLKPVDRPERLGLLNKPKKRSGFCQQCTFEGRSCKIIDCLKHQPLR